MIHCTATPEGRDLSRKDIERMHIKGRGWKRVGYADLIKLDGAIENLIPYNEDDVVDSWEISNGAKGYNSECRHVAYVGGCKNKKKRGMRYYPPKDTRTNKQIQAMMSYVQKTIKNHPNIEVIGHNQVANKACPSFNVPEWLKSIGIAQKNIGL